MGIYANSALSPDDDAYKSPIQQIPEGLGLVGNDLGRDLSGLYDQAKQVGSQGLGLVRQGLGAITPSQDSMNEFAMRLQNASAIANGGVPLYMQQRQQQLEMGQQQQIMEYRRQQLAQQLQQQAETKRQHDMGLLERAMAHPRASAMLEQLSQDPNYSMAQQAGMLHKGLKDADYSSLNAYREFIPQDIQDRLLQGTLPQHELTAWLDMARENAKFTAKDSAKQTVLRRALDKSVDQRSPFEASLVQEHMDEIEKKALERANKEASTKELEARANKEQAEADLKANGGNRDFGNDREALALQMYGRKYGPATRYTSLSGAEQAEVNKALQAFQGTIAQYKTAGNIAGEMSSPVKDPAQWKRVNEAGRIVDMPAGMSKEEAVKEGFRNISGYDQEMKQIIAAPSALRIIDDLHNYAKEMVVAKPGLINRIRQGVKLTAAEYQQAGKPTNIIGADGEPLKLGEVVELYEKTAKANADLLTRAGGGQVGVATEQDTLRSLMNLATKWDTGNVMEEKFRRFGNIFQERYERNVGLVFGDDAIQHVRPRDIKKLSTEELRKGLK